MNIKLPRVIIMFIFLGLLWVLPEPWDVTPQAWHLFAIFITAILAVVIGAVPILTTAIIAVVLAIFLGVGLESGVPPVLIALMLLFATNFFAAITPQGSSANVLCAGSGYLTQGEMYRMGGLVTLTNLLIFMIIGTPWILLVI